MKRQIITFKIIFLFILFLSFLSETFAAIESDDCQACHGLFPGMMEEGPAGEQKYLLQNTLCVNCHSGTGSDSIKTLGGVRVPVVNNTGKPVNPLGGGNFHYVAKGFGDRYGHNVDGITSPDAKFGYTRPGYDIETDASLIGYSSTKPLTCAGSNGCHGNRNVGNASAWCWRRMQTTGRAPSRSTGSSTAPIVEDQARLTELLTGTLDVIVGVPADFVAQLEGNPRVSLLKQVGAHVWYLGMNNQKKPFDDKRVRQALNYAVNKDAIVRDVLKGTGAPSRGPVLPGTWGADAALKAYPHDPERARKLLAEAGYPNGVSTTMWVPESGSGMQAPGAMPTVMQSNLRGVGVNVTLQTMEWGAYLSKLRSKEQELFALSWMAGTEDPDMVMYPLLHSSQWTPNGPNRALYKNERFDDLLQQARQVTDQAKRADLYREAQRLLVEDAPWVFVDHEVQIAATSRRVQGFKLHPSFDLRVETVSLK